MRVNQALHASLGISIGVGVPLWWCITCPAVGGLAIPLVLNYLFFFVAQQICKILNIPPEDQSSIFVMAVAVAMVLSLVAAWPLFQFCDLKSCGDHHPDVMKPLTDAVSKISKLLTA